MKALLLIVGFSFFSSSFFAQEPEKLKKYESITTKRVFTKGDTLLIGDPGKNAFSTQKKYFGIFVKDKRNVCGYSELDSVMKGAHFVIKNITKYTEHCSFEFRNNVVFELLGSNNQLIYMPIEKTLQSKELVVFPNTVKTEKYEQLNDRSVFILTMNAVDQSADFAFKYCRTTDFEKSKYYDNNPSQFEKDKNEWVKKLDQARKQIKVKDTFWITIPVYVGAFIHDKNEFKLADIPGNYGSKAINLNLDTKMIFENYAAFNSIKSTKNQADFFQNTNTPDYNGNRKAYLQVKAVCNSVLKEVSSGPTGVLNTLRFSIIEMHAVDLESMEYNYIGSKKK